MAAARRLHAASGEGAPPGDRGNTASPGHDGPGTGAGPVSGAGSGFRGAEEEGSQHGRGGPGRRAARQRVAPLR